MSQHCSRLFREIGLTHFHARAATIPENPFCKVFSAEDNVVKGNPIVLVANAGDMSNTLLGVCHNSQLVCVAVRNE